MAAVSEAELLNTPMRKFQKSCTLNVWRRGILQVNLPNFRNSQRNQDAIISAKATTSTTSATARNKDNYIVAKSFTHTHNQYWMDASDDD